MNQKCPAKTRDDAQLLNTSLRDYEHLKFELAGLVRDLKALLPRPVPPEVERECQSLWGRLADDQFNLAVIGQFNRGKTSLMNAVLGMDRLPTGIVPLTSVITVVRHGSRECALVEYENSMLRPEITLADLPAYVTEEGNPGNEKHIRTVEVQLPAEILRRGFRFVDTPGLGSAIAANTATTERFLPESDAVVFVTSCDSPLTELEIDYLRTVRRLVHKTFLIVNKSDLLPPRQREQVLAFIRERLAQEGLTDLPLYPLSANEAMRAKLEGANDALGESGLLEFEKALVQFLVTDKSRDFLAQNCDRLLHLATREGVDGDAEFTHRIASLRVSILGEDRRVTSPGASSGFDVAKVGGVHRVCPVCQAAVRGTADFLAKYQYEISHNREVRRRHADNHGFCSRHTWQYAKLTSAHGVSSAYPPLLRVMRDALQEMARVTSEWPAALKTICPSSEHCVACHVQSAAVNASVHELADHLTATQGEFDGMLCLHHLGMVVALVDQDVGRSIVKGHASLMERIAEDMQRFTLKQDGLRRLLMSDDEQEAYRQGVALLAGDSRLVLSEASTHNQGN